MSNKHLWGRSVKECRGGKEDSHACQDDHVAKVLDSLGGLQLLYQLLLVHVHAEAEKYNISMVNKYGQHRNAVLSPGKFTWLQGARREAGGVILSSNPHLICTIEEKTLCQAIERVSGKPLKGFNG